MTGRPKPTHLKLITGNPGKRALNKNEAKPRAIMPDPPLELSADARHEWDKVSVRLHSCGLLTVIDGTVLAGYCQAYGRWQQAERALADMAKRDPLTSGLMIKTHKNNVIQNPLVGTANKAMHDMIRYAAELGMSPAARARVKAETTNPQDDDETFFR